MKKSLYLGSVLLFVAMLFSCSKENLSNGTSSSSSVLDLSMAKQNTLCNCTGFTLKEDNGDYSCPSGDGCTKVTTCPCDVAISGSNPGLGDDLFTISHYNQFKSALDGGTLPAYFSTDKWKHMFPSLRNNPTLLSRLQSGEVTFVERTNLANSIFQVAIPTALLGTNYSTTDVLLINEIPAGIL